MDILEDFIAVFNPHRRKYTVKNPSGTMATVPGNLPSTALREYFEGTGKVVFGFFVGGVQRRFFGIDIDDHVGGGWVSETGEVVQAGQSNRIDAKGWVPEMGVVFDPASIEGFDAPKGGVPGGTHEQESKVEVTPEQVGNTVEGSKPTEALKTKYHEVVKRIGKKPSGIFRSPRGLHLYWLFEKPISNMNLEAVIGSKVTNDKLAEFFPTNNHSLRVPRPQAFLGTDLQEKEFQGFGALKRYPNEELFGGAFEPKALRALGKPEKEPSTRKKKLGEVEFGLDQVKAIEDRVAPFRNGEANDQYLVIVRAHVKAGLNEEQSVARFNALIDGSPEYTGALRSEIEGKVASSYRSLGVEGRKPKVEKEEMEPEIEAFINWAMKETGCDGPHARGPFRLFMLELLAWKRKYDCMKDKKHDLARRNEVDRGLWTRLSKGYYPLPSKALRGWNPRYRKITRLLEGIGVLEEAPGGYHVDAQRCRYYRMNITIPGNEEISGRLKEL